MKRFFYLLVLLLGFQFSNAQYTEIINSNRPGFSMSPYSVGTNVYQLETGVYYAESLDDETTGIINSFGGEIVIRTSQFKEKLEIIAKIGYQQYQTYNYFLNNTISDIDPLREFDNIFPKTEYIETINGISEISFGAKYLIYQQEYVDKSKEIRSWKKRTSFDKKRLIPSVGAFIGVNPNIMSESFKKESVSFTAAALLQNNFSDKLVLVTNLMAEDIATDNIFYTYMLTLTYRLSQNWSIFGENVGRYSKISSPEYHFGTGTAYLFSKDIQIDASFRAQTISSNLTLYGAIGLSWRIDKHQDQLTKEDLKLEKEAKKQQRKKKKKGIFSKIFKKNK